MIRPADIEAIIAGALEDIPAGPPPVPANLSAPYVCIWRTGGSRTAYVIDAFAVSIDVYAQDWASAVELASEVLGTVAGLRGQVVAGTQLGAIAITAMPYANPDPDHPTLPRVTFAAEIIAKATITD